VQTASPEKGEAAMDYKCLRCGNKKELRKAKNADESESRARKPVVSQCLVNTIRQSGFVGTMVVLPLGAAANRCVHAAK